MDYRRATTGDLAKVFRNNDERLTAEYVTAGFNPRRVKDMFKSCVDAGNAHTLTQEGKPLALIVWHLSDGKIYTGFAAIPEFFNAKFVRFCSRHIRQIQASNGGLAVVADSYGTHSDLGRWFSALGFQLGLTSGLLTSYVLPPVAFGSS